MAQMPKRHPEIDDLTMGHPFFSASSLPRNWPVANSLPCGDPAVPKSFLKLPMS